MFAPLETHREYKLTISWFGVSNFKVLLFALPQPLVALTETACSQRVNKICFFNKSQKHFDDAAMEK